MSRTLCKSVSQPLSLQTQGNIAHRKTQLLQHQQLFYNYHNHQQQHSQHNQADDIEYHQHLQQQQQLQDKVKGVYQPQSSLHQHQHQRRHHYQPTQHQHSQNIGANFCFNVSTTIAFCLFGWLVLYRLRQQQGYIADGPQDRVSDNFT